MSTARDCRCITWLTEFEDDALVRALAAFDAPDADDKSNHVCLTAIWFADHLPEQPQMLPRLSDEMMARGQEGEIVY